MTDKVDLYDSHYAGIEQDAHQEVRHATYDEDLGQTSWITGVECRRFLSWLDLGPGKALLEVACGSGGASVLMARESGAAVTGVDINEHAITAATDRLKSLPGKAEGPERVGEGKISFQVANAEKSLPFAAESFDAVFCNDAINHFRDRQSVLDDWYRILGPDGKVLYTDPCMITGMVNQEELAIRSSISLQHWTPIGENERLLRQAGFEIVRCENVTDATASVSKRWHDARAERKQALVAIEGEHGFAGLQRFLHIVHTLSSEGRLSRYVYLARKRS